MAASVITSPVVFDREARLGGSGARGVLRVVLKPDEGPVLVWEPLRGEGLLAWERVEGSETEDGRGISVPLSRVHALRRSIPVLGVPSVTVITHLPQRRSFGGAAVPDPAAADSSCSETRVASLPPLRFFKGGVYELFECLERYAGLVRSSTDRDVFVVSLMDHDGRERDSAGEGSLDDVVRSLRASFEYDVATLAPGAAGTPEIFDPAKSILDGFARFGALAKDLLEEPSLLTVPPQQRRSAAAGTGGDGDDDAMPAASAASAGPAPSGKGQSADGSTTALTALGEFDVVETPEESTRVAHSTALGVFDVVGDSVPELLPYGGKEVSIEEFIGLFDESGVLQDSDALIRRMYQGGCSPDVRPQAWKYLLGVHPWSSTFAEREAIDQANSAAFARWNEMWKFLLDQSGVEIMQGGKAGAVMTARRSSESGRGVIAQQSKLLKRVQIIEKDVARTDRSVPFYEEGYGGADENTPTHSSLESDSGHCDFANCVHLVTMRDVLSSFCMYNQDLGYAQGMNELLSPILYVHGGNGSDAFWCFVGLLQSEVSLQLGAHFQKEQIGMHHNLSSMARLVKVIDSGFYDYLESIEGLNMFFCFRWLLIVWKREFSFLSVQRLWEVCWAHKILNPSAPPFSLFLGLAVLMDERDQLVTMEFDEMLQYCQSLSGKLSLDPLLSRADKYVQLYMASMQLGDATDPSPSAAGETRDNA